MLAELRIVIGLFVLAALSPLAVARFDAHRQVDLRQQAYLVCTMARGFEACSRWWPGGYREDAYRLCRTKRSHADCAIFNQRNEHARLR